MAATPYTDLATYRTLSNLPDDHITEIETKYPGFVLKRIELQSAYVDSRLDKRYSVPFITAGDFIKTPIQVLTWIVALVDLDLWQKRGWDTTTVSSQQYIDDANRAHEQLKEAADAKDGLFGLPLRADTTTSGIVRPGVRSYNTSSPYLVRQIQAKRGREENDRGSGTEVR